MSDRVEGVLNDGLPEPPDSRWIRLQALIELDGYEDRTSAEIAERIEARTSFAVEAQMVGAALRKLREGGWVLDLGRDSGGMQWRITPMGIRVVVLVLRP